MEKLYSRGNRLILPTSTNIVANKTPKAPRFNKKKKMIVTVGIILIIAFAVLIKGARIIEPVFYEVATNEVKQLTVKISNSAAKEVMEGYNYTDLATVHKDVNNNVTMIETNVININKIRAEIAGKMQEEINRIEDDEIKLALGSFTGIKIFIGKGPKIPIKMTSIGDIETEYISQFKTAGINQTNHQICLNIKCKIGIMSPFKTVTTTLNIPVILAENIIVGNVPEAFYNFNGVEGTEMLNMIQ